MKWHLCMKGYHVAAKGGLRVRFNEVVYEGPASIDDWRASILMNTYFFVSHGQYSFLCHASSFGALLTFLFAISCFVFKVFSSCVLSCSTLPVVFTPL